MVENLWGIDTIDQIPGPAVPKRILAEQAALLETITNGLLFAEVKNSVSGALNVCGTLAQGTLLAKSDFSFNYAFAVHAPALNFSVDVFTIHHNIEMYPCALFSKGDGIWCDSDANLKSAIRTILSSDRVKTLIASLVAQSAA